MLLSFCIMWQECALCHITSPWLACHQCYPRIKWYDLQLRSWWSIRDDSNGLLSVLFCCCQGCIQKAKNLALLHCLESLNTNRIPHLSSVFIFALYRLSPSFLSQPDVFSILSRWCCTLLWFSISNQNEKLIRRTSEQTKTNGVQQRRREQQPCEKERSRQLIMRTWPHHKHALLSVEEAKREKLSS